MDTEYTYILRFADGIAIIAESEKDLNKILGTMK